jgi:NADH-quinone oxidoreductase subunit L
MADQAYWFIFLLPVISFAVISLLVKPFAAHKSVTGGYIAIAAIAGSAVLSIWALTEVMGAPNHEIAIPDISWVAIGSDFTINLGIIMDSLTAVMVVVVTIVSLMVQIYSLGYMQHFVEHDDGTYTRYYAWMSLFTASMLGLVIANNLLMMFVFWEMVGLCSYLLIGFWFHKPSAANAAKKAFIVTRFGDFGFLVAILVLYANTGTFDTAELSGLAAAGALAGATLTWVAIGIFAGAMGKSAQFPLHIWLPDAMEGPTPVSALIHSATMVSAGVFLVARTFPIFAHSLEAVTVVATIGGFTAIFAASMGLVMNDIKRVLAYSTISQLGYMMLGLGAAGIILFHEGNVTVESAKAATVFGIFHLTTHAFFKSLLFLGAGSVNHATGTFDMRLMGGLRKIMPWTYITFLLGSLSLAGVWPLAGFWSKDEILITALEGNTVLFVLAMITVFMTAFYMFRVIYMTFHGKYRGGESKEYSHPHESSKVMVAPLVFLAVLAVVAGFWNAFGHFGELMGHGHTKGFIDGFFGIFTHSPWPIVSLLLALGGILLAYLMYNTKQISAERIGARFKPLYVMFSRKYWMDELYEDLIVRKALLGRFFAGLQKIDTEGVDGIVNGAANAIMSSGDVVRKVQTGQFQLYALAIALGAAVIAIVLYIVG